MIPYLRALLYEEGRFLAATRAIFVVAGMTMQQPEQLDLPETLPWRLGGAVLVALGMFMRSYGAISSETIKRHNTGGK